MEVVVRSEALKYFNIWLRDYSSKPRQLTYIGDWDEGVYTFNPGTGWNDFISHYYKIFKFGEE